jgi:4-alpha-glucanotransferase
VPVAPWSNRTEGTNGTRRAVVDQTGPVTDEWGIADGFHDVHGEWIAAPDATISTLRSMMGEPRPADPLWFVEHCSWHDLVSECVLTLEDGTSWGALTRLEGDVPIGYHTLTPADGGPRTRLVVHPIRCPEPPRAWGVAAQVYALWSDRSWGIGDLRDVATLARSVAEAGGEMVLLSPLHAPSPTFPQERSPYYPSTRRAINPLLIPMAGDPPAELRVSPGALIDRDRVWTAKRAVLEAAFADGRWDAVWRDWAHLQGADLWSIARWNTIADDFGSDWTAWPESLRDPSDPTFDRRAAQDPAITERVEFHAWCQWLADGFLSQAAAQGCGLIGDLAVGFAPAGADAWQYQDVVALDARIGAPPDLFNPAGQGWGLPPFIPWKLRAAHYEPFIATVRACLRGVVGLRIDHVMGLFRQYWIPEGTPTADGAYITFPADELLAIIALEATRAGAFVIGEDLGTVQAGVRETMERWGVLSTKVVLFEDDSPDAFPAMSLATVATHDLPTAAGLWSGNGDERLHERLARVTAAVEGEPTSTIIQRIHAQLLSSPALLRLMTTDDLCEAIEQPNLPGTTVETNWARPLPFDVAGIAERLPS